MHRVEPGLLLPRLMVRFVLVWAVVFIVVFVLFLGQFVWVALAVLVFDL